MKNRGPTLGARSIIFVLAISYFSAACGPTDSEFSEYSSFRSRDGEHLVVIDSAHSAFSFGPEMIRVYVVERSTRMRNHIVTTKIANDGGEISNSNIKAEWINSDVIKICLIGVEQKDSVLEINVQNLSHTERKETCS